MLTKARAEFLLKQLNDPYHPRPVDSAILELLGFLLSKVPDDGSKFPETSILYPESSEVIVDYGDEK